LNGTWEAVRFFVAGEYNFEVYFSAPGSNDVLKGEHPLLLFGNEE